MSTRPVKSKLWHDFSVFLLRCHLVSIKSSGWLWWRRKLVCGLWYFEGKGTKQVKLWQYTFFRSTQTYLPAKVLELSPPLPPLQTGQSSCSSQILRSCRRGHCTPSKRATGLKSKQVKLWQRKIFFATCKLTSQLSRWCSRGHCCPYKQYKVVATGMMRVGGVWFGCDGGEVVLGCIGGWLCFLFVVIDGVWFGTQKIKLTFFLQRKHTEFYRVLLWSPI